MQRLLLTTFFLTLFLLTPKTAFAADNMCNVDRTCNTPQDWERGWGDARQPENIDKAPTRTETDTSGNVIRNAGESNRVNRSQKAADDAKAKGGDPVNSSTVTTDGGGGGKTETGKSGGASTQAQAVIKNGQCNATLGLCQAFDPQTGSFTGYVPADKPVYATAAEAKLLRMNVVVGFGPYETKTIGGKTYQVYDQSGDAQGEIGTLTSADINRIKSSADREKAQTNADGRVIIDERYNVEEFNKKVADFWQYQGEAQQAIASAETQPEELARSAKNCAKSSNVEICSPDQLKIFVFTETDAKLLSPDAKNQIGGNISIFAESQIKVTQAIKDFSALSPEFQNEQGIEEIALSSSMSTSQKITFRQNALKMLQGRRDSEARMNAALPKAIEILQGVPEGEAFDPKNLAQDFGLKGDEVSRVIEAAKKEVARQRAISDAISELSTRKFSDPSEYTQTYKNLTSGLVEKDKDLIGQEVAKEAARLDAARKLAVTQAQGELLAPLIEQINKEGRSLAGRSVVEEAIRRYELGVSLVLSEPIPTKPIYSEGNCNNLGCEPVIVGHTYTDSEKERLIQGQATMTLAQQAVYKEVGSYINPFSGNFEESLRKLNLPEEKIKELLERQAEFQITGVANWKEAIDNSYRLGESYVPPDFVQTFNNRAAYQKPIYQFDPASKVTKITSYEEATTDFGGISALYPEDSLNPFPKSLSWVENVFTTTNNFLFGQDPGSFDAREVALVESYKLCTGSSGAQAQLSQCMGLAGTGYQLEKENFQSYKNSNVAYYSGALIVGALTAPVSIPAVILTSVAIDAVGSTISTQTRYTRTEFLADQYNLLAQNPQYSNNPYVTEIYQTTRQQASAATAQEFTTNIVTGLAFEGIGRGLARTVPSVIKKVLFVEKEVGEPKFFTRSAITALGGADNLEIVEVRPVGLSSQAARQAATVARDSLAASNSIRVAPGAEFEIKLRNTLDNSPQNVRISSPSEKARVFRPIDWVNSFRRTSANVADEANLENLARNTSSSFEPVGDIQGTVFYLPDPNAKVVGGGPEVINQMADGDMALVFVPDGTRSIVYNPIGEGANVSAFVSPGLKNVDEILAANSSLLDVADAPQVNPVSRIVPEPIADVVEEVGDLVRDGIYCSFRLSLVSTVYAATSPRCITVKRGDSIPELGEGVRALVTADGRVVKIITPEKNYTLGPGDSQVINGQTVRIVSTGQDVAKLQIGSAPTQQAQIQQPGIIDRGASFIGKLADGAERIDEAVSNAWKRLLNPDIIGINSSITLRPDDLVISAQGQKRTLPNPNSPAFKDKPLYYQVIDVSGKATQPRRFTERGLSIELGDSSTNKIVRFVSLDVETDGPPIAGLYPTDRRIEPAGFGDIEVEPGYTHNPSKRTFDLSFGDKAPTLVETGDKPLVDLSNIGWRGFRDPETGSLQFPVTKRFSYKGPIPTIIDDAVSGRLTPEKINQYITQVERVGVKVTHEGEWLNSGPIDNGYSINIPDSATPFGKLHELTHVEQDLRAIADGVDITQELPLYNRALYEIQATRIELDYLRKWGGSEKEILGARVNLEVWEDELKKLGEEVPEVIDKAWLATPKNPEVEHFKIETARRIPNIIRDVQEKALADLSSLKDAASINSYIENELTAKGVQIIKGGNPRVATKGSNKVENINSLSELYIRLSPSRAAVNVHEWLHVRQVEAVLNAGIPTSLVEDQRYVSSFEIPAYQLGTKIAYTKGFHPIDAYVQPVGLALIKAGFIRPLNTFNEVIVNFAERVKSALGVGEPLGIVAPGFRQGELFGPGGSLDLNWRGFKDPETGRLQFPIARNVQDMATLSLEEAVRSSGLFDVPGVEQHETVLTDVEPDYRNTEMFPTLPISDLQALGRTHAPQKTSGPQLERKSLTFSLPSYGRADAIPLVIQDKNGVRYGVIYRKGVGGVRRRPSNNFSELFGQDTSGLNRNEPRIGLTHSNDFERDSKLSLDWYEKGMRVRMPVASFRLKSVSTTKGIISIDEAVQQGIIGGEPGFGYPVVSVWARRNPFTFRDAFEIAAHVYEETLTRRASQKEMQENINTLLKAQIPFLRLETSPQARLAAQGIQENKPNGWFLWLAKTAGREAGKAAKNGFLQGNMNPQNLTLAIEAGDLGDVAYDVTENIGGRTYNAYSPFAPTETRVHYSNQALTYYLNPIIRLRVLYNIANSLPPDTEIKNIISEFSAQLVLSSKLGAFILSDILNLSLFRGRVDEFGYPYGDRLDAVSRRGNGYGTGTVGDPFIAGANNIVEDTIFKDDYSTSRNPNQWLGELIEGKFKKLPMTMIKVIISDVITVSGEPLGIVAPGFREGELFGPGGPLDLNWKGFRSSQGKVQFPISSSRAAWGDTLKRLSNPPFENELRSLGQADPEVEQIFKDTVVGPSNRRLLDEGEVVFRLDYQRLKDLNSLTIKRQGDLLEAIGQPRGLAYIPGAHVEIIVGPKEIPEKLVRYNLQEIDFSSSPSKATVLYNVKRTIIGQGDGTYIVGISPNLPEVIIPKFDVMLYQRYVSGETIFSDQWIPIDLDPNQPIWVVGEKPTFSVSDQSISAQGIGKALGVVAPGFREGISRLWNQAVREAIDFWASQQRLFAIYPASFRRGSLGPGLPWGTARDVVYKQTKNGIVAEIKGVEIAHVTVAFTRKSGNAVITDIAVNEEYRRQGIATLLTEEAEEYARSHGARSIGALAQPDYLRLLENLGYDTDGFFAQKELY